MNNYFKKNIRFLWKSDKVDKTKEFKRKKGNE